MKKLLILYSEVMPYNFVCFKALIKNFGIEIHLIQWKKNKLTPYEIDEAYGIFVYKREDMSDLELITLAKKISPDLIYVSGWMDKGYLKVCKKFKKQNIKILCGLDNQWNSTIKQSLIVLIRKLYFSNYFTNCFVPGIKQYEYARRLGFKYTDIITGAYTANTNLFSFNQKKKI